FRRRFPDAEITGIDFSERSIAVAKKLQRDFHRKAIRFLSGDLTSNQFKKMARGPFDFISCHGVVSYIPHPERALRNLAGCLSPEGALYLGVNGAQHYSENWRRAL